LHPVRYLLFGFIENVGHHVWQEITGLIQFLRNPECYSNIDGIVIGKYDYFNIETYLEQYYSFPLLHNKLLQEKDIITLDFIPVLLRLYYIDPHDIIPLFCKLYSFEIIPPKPNMFTIVFDIRTYSRILINSESFYIYIIQRLHREYLNYVQNINILFTGRFLLHHSTIDVKTDLEIIEQNKIVSNIMHACKGYNHLFFSNLIGHSFEQIQKEVIQANIMVATAGTSIPNLMNWIYYTKTIYLAHTALSPTFYDIQYNILHNHNGFFCPPEYILNRENGNFEVKNELFYDYWIKQMNLTII